MNNKLALLRLAVCAWILGLTAAPAAWATEARPLKIVATFSILANMAREVAGDAATVSALVGPNGDAHAFEPTPAAIKLLAGADLLVINGLGFELWVDRLVKVSGFKGRVIVASQGVSPRRVRGATDPHAWHSLVHAQTYVKNLRTAVVRASPGAETAIEARTTAYLRRLHDLDQQARDLLQSIPAENRRLITSHDAFGYLGDAYGITVLSPQGWRSSSEPSAGSVAKLIRQIRSEQVRAVFLENISDARLIQQIARESGARVGGTLYSDALSPEGDPASSYVQLMMHNLQAIGAALKP